MEVPIKLVNDIVNYLARQPYKDVATMISGLISSQAQENKQAAVNEIEQQHMGRDQTDQKELPLDDN
jgi:hypothetical protein|tara:strand:- start:414 stop:614 length:201 start_codon:yes stop_codon:yes gene_type:complete